MTQRIPSKLVYLLASSMVCVGLGAWFLAAMDPPEDPRDEEPRFNTSTPEGTAEAFLDAWRRRQHLEAAALSTGPAHEAVRRRAEQDDRATDAQKILKARIWDAMAADSLHLRIEASQDIASDPDAGINLGENVEAGLVLQGTAEGTFREAPYRRRVRFMLIKQHSRWFVHEMELGEILSSPSDQPISPAVSPAVSPMDELEPHRESIP